MTEESLDSLQRKKKKTFYNKLVRIVCRREINSGGKEMDRLSIRGRS